MPAVILASLPAVLWMAFFLVVYVLEVLACKFALGPAVVAAVNGAATVATLGGLGALAGLAWKRARATDQTRAWLARLSLMLCLTTAVATLWVGLPLLLVPGCL